LSGCFELVFLQETVFFDWCIVKSPDLHQFGTSNLPGVLFISRMPWYLIPIGWAMVAAAFSGILSHLGFSF